MLLNLNLYMNTPAMNFIRYVLFMSNVRLNFALYANYFIIVFLFSHYHIICFEQPLMSLQ